MVAGALTLWATFSVVLVAPSLGLSAPVRTAAAGLLSLELSALLAYSYGCELGCSPLGEVAGTAATVDLPALTAAFLVVAAVTALRRRAGRRSDG